MLRSDVPQELDIVILLRYDSLYHDAKSTNLESPPVFFSFLFVHAGRKISYARS
jgi:hypothetical protein